MMIRHVLAICAIVAALAAQASTLNGIPYSSSGDIVLGEFTSQWKKAKAYADANEVPIVALMVKTDCSNCKALEESIAGAMKSGGAFATWMERGLGSQVVLVVSVDGLTESCLSFFGANGTYPFIGVYWPGHVKKWTSLSESKTQSKFRSTAESWLKGYSVYNGGDFELETETEGNRYEIESNDKSVTVPVAFKRAATSKAADDTLVIKAGGKTLATKTISWTVGQANQTVDVTIPAGTLKSGGDQVTMVLNGKEEMTRHITYVTAPVSSANPLWIGERSDPTANGDDAPALDFGEWTMDLDAAKNLAKAQDGYTLLLVTGALWCPNCRNFENNFQTLDRDASGKSSFERWAKDRKVALAVVDVGRLSDGVDDTPTLLSAKAGKSSLFDGGVASGLGYLTRKQADPKQVETVMNQSIKLARTYTTDGGTIRPEDTEDSSCNGYRPRVPCYCLLDKDGNCVTRMTRFSFPMTPVAADQKWYDNYIKRFDEMLAMAGWKGSSHAYARETENDYPGDFSVPLTANGGKVDGELCCADLRDTFRLQGFEGHGKVSVAVKGASTAKVQLSFWEISNGSTNAIKGAVKSGSLSEGVALTHDFGDSGEYYVKVCAQNIGPNVAYIDREFSPTNATPMNFIHYDIKSSLVLVPQESRATGAAPADSDKVTMQLVEGAVYRIEGLGDNASKLDPLSQEPGNVLFRSTAKSGSVELVCATKGGSVTYQKWVPGKVGFELAPVTTPAKKTTKKATVVNRKENESVEVGIRRIEGLSGDVKVKVAVNVDETDFYYDYAWDRTNKKDPRFSVDGVTGEAVNTWTKIVDWPDGKSLDECVGTIVVAPCGDRQNIYYGDGKVTLSLEIESQTSADAMPNKVDNATFVINFADLQKPSAGKVAFIGADRIWAKAKTVYARESDTVKIDVGRLEAMDGNVQAKVKSSVSSVTLGGACNADQVISWNNHEGAAKKLEVSDLPAGKTVKLTLSAVTKGLKTLSSSNTLSIVTVAKDAPAFETECFDTREAYRYAEVSEKFAVTGTVGNDVSFSKVSGSLPSGLKVSWDAESKAMLVSGVPTGNVKTGSSYTAVYQVKEKRPKAEGSSKKETINGLVASISFHVVDPTVDGTGKGGQGAINAACAKSRTFKDLQVVCLRDDGEGADLWGTLQLTLPPTGKASAKFLCASGTVSFAAKSWQCVDWGDATTRTCLLTCSKKAFADWTLSVRALADGSISAELNAPGIGSATVTHKGVQWSKTHPANDCAGYYTVTLADNVVDTNPDIVGSGAELATVGSGYVALTMSSSSQYNTGTMKWAGVLPNGTSFSGSTVLTEVSDELVHLPFIKSLSSGKDFVSGVLAITRGAKDREGKECWETVKEAVAQTAEGEMPVLSKWVRSEKSKVAAVNAKGDFAVRFRPYGGIYDISKHDLGCCCTHEEGRGTDEMRLTVELPAGGSDYFDAFGEVEPIDLKIGESKITRKDSKGGANKISLSFDKKTGVVSGKFNLRCAKDGQSKTLTATYKGIVELGFGSSCGCETSKPFVSGYWTFDDKFTYESGNKTKTQAVKRGGLFAIDVN